MQRRRREAERRQKAEAKRQRRLERGQKSAPAALSEGERKEEPLREAPPSSLSRSRCGAPANLLAKAVIPEQARLRWILRALNDSAELRPGERELLATAAQSLEGQGVLSARQRKQLEKLYRECG